MFILLPLWLFIFPSTLKTSSRPKQLSDFLWSASSGSTWSSVRSTRGQICELRMNCCFSVVHWLAQAEHRKPFTSSMVRMRSLVSGAPKLEGPYFPENKCKCHLSQNASGLRSACCFYIACFLRCFFIVLFLKFPFVCCCSLTLTYSPSFKLYGPFLVLLKCEIIKLFLIL